MNRIVGFSVAAFALCAFGEDKTVTWNAAETPASVADGAVALEYEDGAVKSLKASNSVGDRVTFGGDAMAFAADAEVAAAAGPLVFSGGASAVGGVRFTSAPQKFEYGSYKTGVRDDAELACQISTPAKKVLDGIALADVEVLSGALSGNSVSEQYQGLVMSPFHAVRTATTLAVQMQVMDGDWNKCVKLELEQRDDGIYAKAVYARYGKIIDYPLGNDFDLPGHYAGDQGIGNETTWGGYSVKGLTFAVVAAENRLTVSKPFAVGGTAALTNVEMTVTGEGTLGPSVGVVAPLSLSGASLSFVNPAVPMLTFDREIVGDDSTLAFRCPAADAAETEERVETTDTAFRSSVWVTVLENCLLMNVVGVSAPHLIQNNGTMDLGDGEAFFFVNDGSRVTCQLQVLQGGWNKCAFLEMVQDGLNVKARVFKANWAAYPPAVLGTDLATDYVGTSECNYYPSAFTVHLRNNGMMVLANVANSLRNSAIVVGENVMLNVNAVGAIPQSSGSATLDVEAGGVVNLNVAGDNAKGLNNNTDITVHRGGTLSQTKAGAFSQSKPVTLDGGTLAFAPVKVGGGSAWDSGTYLNFLTFRDGGRTAGATAPRVGLGNAMWTVAITGDADCSREACSHLSGAVLANDVQSPTPFSHKYVWTFDVGDVTGDDAPDFLFGGHVDDYVATVDYTYYGVTRRKAGAGTMRIVPETWSNSITGRWEIAQGTLQVGVSGVFAAERGYELSMKGGTLALEAGVANSFASFADLIADSAISLADGATLELPGAPANWTEGKRLAVTLGEGARLRFGTGKDALTRAQLALVSVNGEKAKLDDDGYVKPSRFGTTVIVR